MNNAETKAAEAATNTTTTKTLHRPDLAKLRGAEHKVYLCLTAHADDNAECSISGHSLANETGYSYRAVVRAINSLVDDGYVSRLGPKAPSQVQVYRILAHTAAAKPMDEKTSEAALPDYDMFSFPDGRGDYNPLDAELLAEQVAVNMRLPLGPAERAVLYLFCANSYNHVQYQTRLPWICEATCLSRHDATQALFSLLTRGYVTLRDPAARDFCFDEFRDYDINVWRIAHDLSEIRFDLAETAKRAEVA